MFKLTELPYELNALEPHMSKRTLEFHHGKHHNAYVTKLNSLLEGSPWEQLPPTKESLEKIVVESYKKNDALFNNAAQNWNHILFWNNMKPQGGGMPGAELLQRIKRDFGSFEGFKEQFQNAAMGQFGSGWAWLVQDGERLEVMKTPNGENPLIHGKKALVGLDVWEHSYYLDYQNRRLDFVVSFLDHMVNWAFAEAALVS